MYLWLFSSLLLLSQFTFRQRYALQIFTKISINSLLIEIENKEIELSFTIINNENLGEHYQISVIWYGIVYKKIKRSEPTSSGLFKCKIYFIATCRIHGINHKQLGKKRYGNVLIRFREFWGNLFATNFLANSQVAICHITDWEIGVS